MRVERHFKAENSAPGPGFSDFSSNESSSDNWPVDPGSSPENMKRDQRQGAGSHEGGYAEYSVFECSQN